MCLLLLTFRRWRNPRHSFRLETIYLTRMAILAKEANPFFKAGWITMWSGSSSMRPEMGKLMIALASAKCQFKQRLQALIDTQYRPCKIWKSSIAWPAKVDTLATLILLQGIWFLQVRPIWSAARAVVIAVATVPLAASIGQWQTAVKAERAAWWIRHVYAYNIYYVK